VLWTERPAKVYFEGFWYWNESRFLHFEILSEMGKRGKVERREIKPTE